MNSAGFDDVDDMKAAFAALKGVRAVIGLAVQRYQSQHSFEHCDSPINIPRSANAVACRVVENMAAT